MEQMTVMDVVQATGGRLLCGEESLPLGHISIDSREVKAGDLFVPLIGEHSDAHRFLDQVLARGAGAVLTSEHDRMEDSHAWIRVEDTKKALQAVGAYYRNRLKLPLVGITGSVGKTTTREMVAAALSAGLKTFKTPGNYNSQVGVPITMSEIREDHQIAVIELGMSEPGEMTVIAGIARVDMAVITNIGVTHIGQLGSQENIYREKMAIQDGMKPGGTLILNGDDPWLQKSRAKEGCRTVYYGTGPECDYRAEEIRLQDGCASFTAVCPGRRVPVTLRVMGGHQVGNALAALAVADLNGVDVEQAARALERFEGYRGRQQIHMQDGVMIIDDTYNASPASMKAAIDILASLEKAERRIAVLADMKELGEDEVRYHREVGEHLARSRVDLLVTYGELAEELAAGAMARRPDLPAVHFQDREQLEQYLFEQLRPGDAVLLKGSNSMKLGETAHHVCQHHY